LVKIYLTSVYLCLDVTSVASSPTTTVKSESSSAPRDTGNLFFQCYYTWRLFIIYRPGTRGFGGILPEVIIFPEGLCPERNISSLRYGGPKGPSLKRNY
jgi:hypothetical protein